MPKFRLFLIAASALAFSGTAILSGADAAGYRSSKQTAGKATVLKGKKRQAMKSPRRVATHEQRTVRTARVVPTAAKQPGSCGTFMYWKDGKCNDARDKK
jgi:hypothetical protein